RFLPRVRKQRNRIGNACHADERRLQITNRWIEAQRRRRDDAERALGADEQLLQVVTGRVVPQGPPSIPGAAVRQVDLEPQDLVTRGAITKHIDAARVGGKVATNLATAFGREAQRKQAVDLCRRRLYRGQYAACFHHHRIIEGRDRTDLVETGERQQNL